MKYSCSTYSYGWRYNNIVWSNHLIWCLLWMLSTSTSWVVNDILHFIQTLKNTKPNTLTLSRLSICGRSDFPHCNFIFPQECIPGDNWKSFFSPLFFKKKFPSPSDAVPRRSKPKPPASLSANQTSAGVVLRWSLPETQHPPITGFVLQSRTEQGEWFNLDEDISANSREIVVPGLRKVTSKSYCSLWD